MPHRCHFFIWRHFQGLFLRLEVDPLLCFRTLETQQREVSSGSREPEGLDRDFVFDLKEGPVMKIGYIGLGAKPRIIEHGTELCDLQDLVEGLIEPFDVLFGESPLLWVNEEGLFTQAPNRAVYADASMEQAGYLSQIDGQPVREGDLFTILFGNIVAVSYDRDAEGETVARDIAEEEFERLARVFEDPNTGFWEVLRIKAELRQARSPESTIVA